MVANIFSRHQATNMRDLNDTKSPSRDILGSAPVLGLFPMNYVSQEPGAIVELVMGRAGWYMYM